MISTRLHSSIFATVAGVPFLDITHNHKNPEFLRSIRRSDLAVPYMTFDAERCKSLLGELLDDPIHRTLMATAASKQKKKLLEAVSDVRLG